MHLILTYTKASPIWAHSHSASLFLTQFGQHWRIQRLFGVMQASHYAVIHLRYVTKNLILGGESDGVPAQDAGRGECHPSLRGQGRAQGRVILSAHFLLRNRIAIITILFSFS